MFVSTRHHSLLRVYCGVDAIEYLHGLVERGAIRGDVRGFTCVVEDDAGVEL